MNVRPTRYARHSRTVRHSSLIRPASLTQHHTSSGTCLVRQSPAARHPRSFSTNGCSAFRVSGLTSFGIKGEARHSVVQPIWFGAYDLHYLDRVIQLPGPPEKSSPYLPINRGAGSQWKGSFLGRTLGRLCHFWDSSSLLNIFIQAFDSRIVFVSTRRKINKV